MIFSDMLSIIYSWNKIYRKHFKRLSLVPTCSKKKNEEDWRSSFVCHFIISHHHRVCLVSYKDHLIVVWLPGQSVKPFLKGHTVPFFLWVRKLKKTEVNYSKHRICCHFTGGRDRGIKLLRAGNTYIKTDTENAFVKVKGLSGLWRLEFYQSVWGGEQML